MEITKNYLNKPKRDPHLHSPNHVLADELSSKLGDPKHFGYYLKTAQTTDHNVLRHIMGGILEGKSSSPGALFAYLVKKYNREKDVSSGYSVWLLPEEKSSKALRGIIASFSQTFDSQSFKPHVTLVGGLDNNVEQINLDSLSALPPLLLNIEPAATEDEFFKSIYLPVVKNKFLLALRRHVNKLFVTTTRGTYKPHLSLLYSNTPDPDKRSSIKEILPQSNLPSQIVFDRVALVHTQGRTNDWQVKQVINLNHSNDL